MTEPNSVTRNVAESGSTVGIQAGRVSDSTVYLNSTVYQAPDEPSIGIGPDTMKHAIVRIFAEKLAPNGENTPVGVGFVVDELIVLTSADVVYAALGLTEGAQPPDGAAITVDFPLLPNSDGDNRVRTASIEELFPHQGPGVGDLAVLRLDEPVAQARPLRLVKVDSVWKHRASAFGVPDGSPAGVWNTSLLEAPREGGWVQMSPYRTHTGYVLSHGFGGGPVWDEMLGAVVGMMVIDESATRPISCLVPTECLVRVWPRLEELTQAPSPFRSLKPFETSDQAIFHGRTAESDDLANTVAKKRVTMLIGPSGCGKSSLAQAGVIPRREADGDIPVLIRPTGGSSPLHALADALVDVLEPDTSEIDRLSKRNTIADELTRQGLSNIVPRILRHRHASRLLVVIDQFEELLELPQDAVRAFADTLVGDRAPTEVAVFSTLRADFMDSVLTHEHLRGLISSSLDSLLPMSSAQLHEAITEPVKAAPGMDFEDGLVEQILSDTGGDARSLPLLAFTLDQLWRAQDKGGELTFRAYYALGGVAGALKGYAEETWAKIGDADRHAAERLLVRLVRTPIGAEAPTRCIVPRAELSETEWRVAQHLVGARLVILNSHVDTKTESVRADIESIELAHEVLITAWPTLAQLVKDDAAFLAWHESLRHDMHRWENAKHDETNAKHAAGLLPSPLMLHEAKKKWGERDADLNSAEREYLKEGEIHQRSRTRRRRVLSAGISIVAALALALGTLFAYAQQQSAQQQALANSRALAQASQDQSRYDPGLSVMLAMAAYNTSQTPEARNQLLRQYLEYSNSARVFSGLSDNIASFHTSRDGNVIFANTIMGHASLFLRASTSTVRNVPITLPGQYVIYTVVSPSGRRVGFIDEDGRAGWFDVNADATDPVGPVHQLQTVTDFTTDTIDDPRDYSAMSTDGKLMAAYAGDRLVWWELDKETIAGSVPASNLDGRVWISSDKQTLLAATLDDALREGLVAVDMANGQTRTVVAPAKHQDFLLSGDRTAVAVCQNQDGNSATVTLRRVSDGSALGNPYRPASSDGLQCGHLIAADASGQKVVLRQDSGLMLVDLRQGVEISRIEEQRDISIFCRDLVSIGGKLFLAGRGDSNIAYTELPTHSTVLDVAAQVLTANGQKVLSLLTDGTFQLRPAGAGSDTVLAQATGPDPKWDSSFTNGGSPGYLKLNSDGTLLADLEDANTVSIRETSTLRQIARITAAVPPNAGPEETDFAYYFDADGRLLTVSGAQVQQWDEHTGKLLAQFDTTAFHPKTDSDGNPGVWAGPGPGTNQIAVIVHGDPAIKIVDLTTGHTTASITATDDAIGIQFDPSDRSFALLRQGGVIELWSMRPLRRELGPFRSIGGVPIPPWWAHFVGTDGLYLIAANDAIRTYRIDKQSYVDSFEFGHPDGTSEQNPYKFYDVSKDGKVVLYANDSGIGGPLALNPAAWEHSLCDIIGHRSFTDDEKSSLPVPVTKTLVCAST